MGAALIHLGGGQRTGARRSATSSSRSASDNGRARWYPWSRSAPWARTLDSRVASSTPTEVSGQGDPGARDIEGGFDLRDGSLSLAVSAAAQTLPPGWNGETPRGMVLWSGPWRTPARRVDANAFVNAVAVRALEREQARIAEQKRQDLERLRALTTQPAPALSPDGPAAPAH